MQCRICIKVKIVLINIIDHFDIEEIVKFSKIHSFYVLGY